MKTPLELITDIELESSNKMVDELSRAVLKFESSNSELIQRIEKLEQKLESKIITENESKAKLKFNYLKKMVQPCGPPPFKPDD